MVKERGFQIDQERRNSNPQKSLYYADFFSIQKIEYLKISPPRGLANATPSCRNVTFLFNDVSDSCFNGEGEEISHLKYKAVFGGYLRAKKAHTNF